MNGFRLFEPQASTVALPVDLLFFAMLGLCAVVAIGVVLAMSIFAVRYRRGSAADRTQAKRESFAIEGTWTVVVLVLFLLLFIWAQVLYYRLGTPPEASLEMFVVAKQWMWKLQHPEGRREINELHVPLGRPVKLVMTSEDVIHSFYVPAFRVKQDVLPGRYTLLWFEATQSGEFPLFCAEYCGTDHSRMGGRIVVMEPARYAEWLAHGNPDVDLAVAGAERFRALGCSGCHGANASVRAPKLDGLFGHPVQLADGRTVIADERYIRDSVLLPQQEVVAGYAPIMPSYQGQVSEEDLLALLAYVKSLANAPAPAR